MRAADPKRLMLLPVWLAAGLSGLIVAARAWRPLTFPVHVNSPLNAESVFALCGLLLWLARATTPEPARPGRSHSMATAVLLAATIVAFYGTAHLYFLSDDFLLLKHAASTWQHPWARFMTAGGDGFYRPVGYLVLGVSAPWAATNPLPWHIAGLVLHAVNVVLVLLLASRLGLSGWAAWIAAAVFAVHGSRPESVVWLAGRFDLVATLFVLLALLAFLKSWHVLGLLAMTLGMLSKESAYALPLILAVLAATGRARWKAVVPYFAVAAALFAFRWNLLGGIGGYSGGAVTIAAAVKALVLRLWAVLFFPIDWAWPGGTALGVMIGIGAAGLICLFTAVIPRDRLLLGIGFTVAAALPAVQQLLIGPDLQKSRILYLPSIGFCLLAGMAVERLKPRWAVAASVAVLAFQFAALRHNVEAWAYASGQAKSVCEGAARSGALATPPGSLNGVYFFANGFPECVELVRRAR
jgi:hypothetical protein